MRNISVFFPFTLLPITCYAFDLSISSMDFNVEPEFSDVREFQFSLDFDGDLSAGVYNTEAQLNSVSYQVSGSLVDGTPSGFPAFALSRPEPMASPLSASVFFTQGSSYEFEISTTAELNDGLQADELIPNEDGVIFTFNGRELNTGRFHPALFVLRDDGTGSIRNSNNMPNPETTVDFGEEYITNFTFDIGNLTLTESTPTPTPTITPEPTSSPTPVETDRSRSNDDDGGIGSIGVGTVFFIYLASLYRFSSRKNLKK